MYWLGISRWCLGPLCMLHSVWICLFLAFTLFLLLLRCLILLYVLVDVYLKWREGCVGFWAHIFFLSSFLGLGVAWAKVFICLLSLCFLLYGCGPFWPLILPYYFILSAIALPLFLFLIIPWVCGLPWPNFHVFTSFRLIGQCSRHTSPFYHFIPWNSSANLLLLPLFTPMYLLLNSLGFLNPFTTSLPLIILLDLLAFKLAHWVYQFIPWASLTHLLVLYFSLFPWAYYFIFWASSAHLLLFTSFHGSTGHQSYWFSPLGLLPCFFTVLPLIVFSSSLLLGFFYYWALCQKMDINRLFCCSDQIFKTIKQS